MKSIRRQLIVSLVLGVVALALAAGSGLYFYVRHALIASLDAALTAKAEAVAAMVRTEDDGQPRLQIPQQYIAEFSEEHGETFFQIRRADGRTFARSPSLGTTDLDVPEHAIRHHGFGNVDLPAEALGRARVLLFVPQPDEDQEEDHHQAAVPSGEEMTLVLARDRRSVDQPMRVLLTGLLVTAGLMTGGIIALVTLGVRRGLRPLGTIARESERIGPEALDRRFPAESVPVELRPICLKLNELLDRLHAAFLRERRFSADVAHELRTPIAELRSLAEIALKWPGDVESTSTGFGEALAIARQMESTVGALLSLVRCQAGAEFPHLQPTDLQDLIAPIWAALENSARQRELCVHFDVPLGIAVETDPAMLGIVIRNLLANAIEYAPIGGKVRVEVCHDPQGTRIKIGNTNDSLEPADTQRLFEPFWRKDAARTSGLHAGLGLAIASEYCKVLQVPVEVELEPRDWFEVRLSMPAEE